LVETGDLYAWGTNANGELGITGSYQLTPQLVPFFCGKKIQQVATGGYHSLALTGTVYRMFITIRYMVVDYIKYLVHYLRIYFFRILIN